jgi:hypothetical protein
MLLVRNQNVALKRHTKVACAHTPLNAQVQWHGTITAPPTFGVTMACAATPPLRREQWHEISGIASPAKPKSLRYQWPILY